MTKSYKKILIMRNTLTDLFINVIEDNDPGKKIFYTKENDIYETFSVEELRSSVFNLVRYLKTLDLKAEDKAAIISENRIEWVITDFACMFSGLVTIPVYVSLSDLQIKYILQNSGAKICFVSNKLLLEKILRLKSDLPELEKIIIFNSNEEKNNDNKPEENQFEYFWNIINLQSGLSSLQITDELKKMSDKVDEQNLLTIIYTSGTTGIPKGVMLTHKNIYTNVIACRKVLTIDTADVFLSYLPYSHAYERTAGYYLAFFSGSVVYYAQSIDTIGKQLSEAKPTMVITVPRLLDKMYNKLLKSGDEMKKGLKKKIFIWAIESAHNKDFDRQSIKSKIADKLVYKKIREKTGGNIRYFVTGGGAMNKNIAVFFENIGISVLEGYGMTETSPVISVNPPGKNKYGTVGKPLEGVKLKLSEENEILIKGELVMQGYYKDEQSTEETIVDEWLYSGDIGEIDEDGYLKITDRKKSLIKSSGGKYIAPTQIEELISTLPYIENIMIVGNEKMYVTALIVADKQELISFAKKNNIENNSYAELLEDNSLIKLIEKDINTVQKNLSGYEKIRKFTLLEEPFSIEGGELTPTMKVKRKFVENKYKEKIEKMYLKV